MTEVSFHVNVADRADYAYRMVRKACRVGMPLAITGPAALLGQLDRSFWTREDLDFLPHRLLRPGVALPADAAATPVWLLPDPSLAPAHQMLVNLGTEPPRGFESFEKMIEIVGTEEEELAAARERWKHYAGRGYAPRRHEAAA